MKYYFPIHLDSGNRGCEAIAKGTATILGKDKSQLIGLCRDILLDRSMGLDGFVQLHETPKWSVVDKIRRKVYYGINRNHEKRKDYIYRHDYKDFLDQMSIGDILVSTGGDMMCYDNNQVLYTANYAHDKGIKTILWGCSMADDNLTKEKEYTLSKFDLIYARESLTYDFLLNLGLDNVICYPDPAFILEPEPVLLPELFSKGDVIGINISNYVIGGFDLNTRFGFQVIRLVDYLLENTNLHVLLIPHVTWHSQDDRVIARLIYDNYSESGRVQILNIDNLNYCQIRYVISKCRFFIGARTHAVISAYSTCVPTLALGYSIKSKGIAKDLKIGIDTVVDSKKEVDLISSVKLLISNESKYKEILNSVIPEYVSSLKLLKNEIQFT